jgi:hypothetical protein
MRTFRPVDAKNKYCELIDLAKAAPVRRQKIRAIEPYF